jgi:uncharacterized membrane protein
MEIVEGLVSRPLEACWRAFVDAPRLAQWVPALRSARVVEERDGMPCEIAFELLTGTTYSLLYTYDHAARTIHWVPKPGTTGGISGEARFEESERGTLVTLAFDRHPGRSFAERSLDDAHALVAAFARWMDAS